MQTHIWSTLANGGFHSFTGTHSRINQPLAHEVNKIHLSNLLLSYLKVCVKTLNFVCAEYKYVNGEMSMYWNRNGSTLVAVQLALIIVFRLSNSSNVSAELGSAGITCNLVLLCGQLQRHVKFRLNSAERCMRWWRVLLVCTVGALSKEIYLQDLMLCCFVVSHNIQR